MQAMLRTAINAAQEAGSIIARYAHRIDQLTIHHKNRHDFVSEVDQAAEQTILSILRKAYPDHAILGEETGQHGDTETSDYEWIIDPLDGTTNFLYGIPHYAVSIAMKKFGRLEHAVVYDPAKDELFSASRGDGAVVNHRRLRVSSRPSLENALLTTGIPYLPHQDLPLYLETLKVLVPDTAGIRRPGSAALDLAYVAAGRFDGFWEFGLNSWDIAAGALLVQEAGGIVTDCTGDNRYLDNGNIVAASPKVHMEMMKRLQSVM